MLPFLSIAQEQNTENTLKLSGPSPESSIEDISWIAGHWVGDAFGGVGEEIWSKPMGGAMMGCYRAVKNDTVNFYEMLLIREVNNSLLLQIKHFNPNLSGWEEKDETVDFPFVKKEGNRVYFEGFTFERNSEDKMTIYLAVGSKNNNSLKEYVFPYVRKTVLN